jgi:quercetin dioxygenase-like cupin family protein
MDRTIRRVVTGHDDAGKAVVAQDGALTFEMVPTGDAAFAKIWTTAQSPADINDPADGAQRPTGLTLPGGTVIRVVDTLPGGRSPMHRTRSVDYGVVLEGQIEMELDDGVRVKLKAGDVVVQRGANHAWVNTSDSLARMVFVLVDSTPVLINGRPLEEVAAQVGADHL